MKNTFLSQYETLVFDCDGVVLNSNQVKTQAFFDVAKQYGLEAANKLVEYHMLHGGMSRYKKFEYFIQVVLNKNIEKEELDNLLQLFAQKVRKGLLTCGVAEGLDALREQTKGTCWLIVSGSDEKELREIFSLRNIAHLFDGGIFGSPDNKELILRREAANGNIKEKGLFLGDSQYDYQVAVQAEMDFLFISEWSEWVGVSSELESVQNLKELLKR
ncbi:MAG: HAD family hydrolase [Methylococcales symbiont of Hymedesmia sp. n. MRB-2018]|nr:MAG: HAD family hydrolase [Methylococcales symbiont of Hymedesmia sp. n. MRB-2018]